MVDVEGFGAADRTTPDRVAVRRGLLHAVKTAFREAGVRWRGLHVEDGGDELLVLVPAKVAKAVFVERVPQVLADRLRAYNARHRRQARMRLRAAVHAGEVLFHDGKATAPAIIKARRLLDAAELKSALAESDRTLMAHHATGFDLEGHPMRHLREWVRTLGVRTVAVSLGRCCFGSFVTHVLVAGSKYAPLNVLP